MGKLLKSTQAFPKGGREGDGRKLGPLGSHHRRMDAAVMQLSNHPAFEKLGSHHTCHSSNSPRKASSPGWTRWINTSKHMKVQESRARSGRRKDSSVCPATSQHTHS